MNPSILQNCPQTVRDFLFYMETIRGRSPRTVQAYYTDLHTFFCFMKIHKGLVKKNTDFKEIDISDITIEFIRGITLSDVYEFLNYVMSIRDNNAKTRARKVSSLRSFYKYLTNKANLLEENPIQELEIPALKKSLPKYLTLEQSIELLTNIDSSAPQRDYCMVTLFLNCGIRLSELVGLNLSNIHFKEKTQQRYNIKYIVISFLLVLLTILAVVITDDTRFAFMNMIVRMPIRTLQIVLLWIAADVLAVNKEPFWWMKISFIIYCSHSMILESIEKVFLIVLGKNMLGAFLDFVFAPIITVGIIILISMVVKRIKPLWKLLSGNR